MTKNITIPLISTLNVKIAKNLSGVFFDIDDTFTTRGKIHACAFQALWALREEGLRAVPITGRPAGWCDHIARMWPVDGVIGENGAFYFWMDSKEKKLKRHFFDSEKVRAENRKQLSRIREEILDSVPGTAVASDQLYREADLAIDYREDVNPLDKEGINQICRIFKKHGVTCKISSTHVNGWFGNYDKLYMTKTFVSKQWKLDLNADKERFLFCGDSPNDEPMFKYFPHSAGVRNILRFADHMEHLPTFMAGQEGGEGFAEIVETILRLRSRKDQ